MELIHVDRYIEFAPNSNEASVTIQTKVLDHRKHGFSEEAAELTFSLTFDLDDFESQMDEIEQVLLEMTEDHALMRLRKCESPIELKFFWNAMARVPGLIPQVEVGPYRIDLAIPDKKIAIELDGHDFHKTKSQRSHDAKRDRFLIKEGWRVIRFTGSEVHANVDKCIEEAITIVESSKQIS